MKLVARRGLVVLGAWSGLVAWRPARAASVDEAAALRERRMLFGSPCDIELSAASPARAHAAMAAAWRALQRIHERWNAWKPGELGTLNAALRAGKAVTVAPDLLAMLRSAAVLERASAGLFNPAIGGLVGAWGFHADVLRPGPALRAATLQTWRRAAPSLAQLEIRGTRLRSSNPFLQLDFGAYAKGVAIDRVLDGLHACGCDSALINLGGNLATFGRPDGRDWRIGIRDPHGDGLVATLATLAREAVVTSGSCERFRWVGGERCSHVLDPALGRPAVGLASVTVVHRSAAFADAAATALLAAGPERWRAIAERLGADSVLVVDADGRSIASPQFAARAWRRGAAGIATVVPCP